LELFPLLNDLSQQRTESLGIAEESTSKNVMITLDFFWCLIFYSCFGLVVEFLQSLKIEISEKESALENIQKALFLQLSPEKETSLLEYYAFLEEQIESKIEGEKEIEREIRERFKREREREKKSDQEPSNLQSSNVFDSERMRSIKQQN
jgi:hypothetical protein